MHNWQGNHEAHTIFNRNFGESRITGLEVIDPSRTSFLAVGSNDGCIRVWKDYFDATKPPKLVTSFVALKKHVPRRDGRDFLISWQQHESTMVSAHLCLRRALIANCDVVSEEGA